MFCCVKRKKQHDKKTMTEFQSDIGQDGVVSAREANASELLRLWENTQPSKFLEEAVATKKAIDEKRIIIKKILSKEMLPIKSVGVAKFVLSKDRELFTLSAATGVRRDIPRAYTHPTMVGGDSVLTAGWIYPDQNVPNKYTFSNVTGHYKVNLKSLDALKPVLRNLGLTGSDYRFSEFYSPATMNPAVMALRNPEWSLPAPIAINNNEPQ